MPCISVGFNLTPHDTVTLHRLYPTKNKTRGTPSRPSLLLLRPNIHPLQVGIYGKNLYVPRKYFKSKKTRSNDYLWAAIGGVMCSEIELISDKLIKCVTGAAPLVPDPTGVSASYVASHTLRACPLGAEVSVCNVHRFGKIPFYYKQAQLFNNTPGGPPTGGFSLDIWGTGFPVASDKAINVTIGGKPCPALRLVSPTQLRCEAPPGIPLSRVPIIVSFGETIVDTRDGGGLWLNYWGVEIHRIKPNHCPTKGGKSISLYGRYFGAIHYFSDMTKVSANDDGHVPAQGEVLIGQFSCRRAVLVTDSQILCECPAGTGLNLPVRIGVFVQNHTAETAMVRADVSPVDRVCNVTFNYDEPEITSVAPQVFSSAGGTRLSILGMNLGYVADQGWEPIEFLPSNWDDKSQAPETVYIRREMLAWGQDNAYSWTDNTVATWTRHLKREFFAMQLHLRTRAEKELEDAITNDADLLLQRSRAAREGAAPKKIRPFAGQLFDKLLRTHTRVVEMASRLEKGFQQRSEANLLGMYRLYDQSVGVQKNRARRKLVGNKRCTKCNITELVPDDEDQDQGIDTELLELIEIASKNASTNASTNAVTNVAWEAPVSVTISSTDPARPVTIPCTELLAVSWKQVECVVGPGVGTDYEVEISVNNVTSKSQDLIAFEPPRVTRVVPSHGPPRGGFAIRISGSPGSFGQTNETAAFIRVFIGGSQCKSTRWISPQLLECFSAPASNGPYSHPGTDADDIHVRAKSGFVKIPEKVVVDVAEPKNSSVLVRVEVAGQLSPKPTAGDEARFEFDSALILAIEPSTASTAGGSVVTVSGYNFGIWAASGGATLQIDGRNAPCTEWRLTNVNESDPLYKLR